MLMLKINMTKLLLLVAIQVINLILQARADVNVLSDRHGNPTLLHWADKNGSIEKLNILLAVGVGGSIHTKNQYGKTPLYQAVVSGNVQVVSSLLQPGGDINTALDQYQNTLLHCAAISGNIEAVHVLLAKDVSINAYNLFILFRNKQEKQERPFID